MGKITLDVAQTVNTEQPHKGDNKDDDDDDDDSNNNNNNKNQNKKCSRESLVLTTEENKRLHVTLVNNFQLSSDNVDEITRLFTQSGELTTKMTTKYRSAYRLRVTGYCREFMPTDYRRSYIEGVKRLESKNTSFVLEKGEKPL